MRSTTARWVWPLLGIIIILFVVKVRAPRDWRRVAIAPFSQLLTQAALFPPPVQLADLGLDEWPTPLTSSINIRDLVRPHLAAAEKDGVLSASRLPVHRGWEGTAGATVSISGFGDRARRPATRPATPVSLFAESTEAPMEFLSDLVVGPQVAEIAGIVARRYSDQPEANDSLSLLSLGEQGDLWLWNGSPSPRMRVATAGRWPTENTGNRQWVYRRTSDSTRERLNTWPQCAALLAQLDQLKRSPDRPGVPASVRQVAECGCEGCLGRTGRAGGGRACSLGNDPGLAGAQPVGALCSCASAASGDLAADPRDHAEEDHSRYDNDPRHS
jgi:hypothetical protein